VIGDVVVEVAGSALRWLFVELVANVLIGVPGRVIVSVFRRDVGSNTFDAAVLGTGILFWVVIGVAGYVTFRVLG